jgi:predicted DsbA family dithiol-disulfide isomerase
MKIEIASDVMCPWCAIGYKSLEKALQQLNGEIKAEIKFKPFELNPNMPEEGQDLSEHLIEKYGITEQQSQENRQHIAERGQELGFVFNFTEYSHMYNTFNCHRLLAWADQFGKQVDLKLAMLKAHFSDNQEMNNFNILLDIAESVGLDRSKAQEFLNSDRLTDEVRQEEAELHQKGIQSVPTFIINDKYAITGGQPPDVFVQALRQIQSEQSQTD